LWCGHAEAYTILKSAPDSPAGTEQALIASVTNQFNVDVIKNPLVPNTWQLTLHGTNPAYNPAPTNQQLLQAVVDVNTNTYFFGWLDGQRYERFTDLNQIEQFAVNCSTPGSFNLVQSSTPTWMVATCDDALWTAHDAIYQQEFSTPTAIVPRGF
jgi:hypothetical protein